MFVATCVCPVWEKLLYNWKALVSGTGIDRYANGWGHLTCSKHEWQTF